MLAELAMFNAGFAVLKQTVMNGKDITEALGSLSNMVGAEEDLRAAGNRKKKSVWSKLAGKNSDDFEEFISLHQIKERRKELESMVRLYASFSWDDYLAFEGKMRRKRKREAEERQRMIARQMRYFTIGAAFVLSAVGFYLLFAFTNFLKEL
tara:strand:- start:2757 stop:3212 length:456 start_codon:yes stop_codon:yes gene_type:complete